MLFVHHRRCQRQHAEQGSSWGSGWVRCARVWDGQVSHKQALQCSRCGWKRLVLPVSVIIPMRSHHKGLVIISVPFQMKDWVGRSFSWTNRHIPPGTDSALFLTRTCSHRLFDSTLPGNGPTTFARFKFCLWLVTYSHCWQRSMGLTKEAVWPIPQGTCLFRAFEIPYHTKKYTKENSQLSCKKKSSYSETLLTCSWKEIVHCILRKTCISKAPCTEFNNISGCSSVLKSSQEWMYFSTKQNTLSFANKQLQHLVKVAISVPVPY